MNEQRISEIAQRLAAATPGEWSACVLEYYWRPEDGPLYEFSVQVGDQRIASIGGADDKQANDNADFIAHAPEDMRLLLAEVERQKELAQAWWDQMEIKGQWANERQEQVDALLAENARLREAVIAIDESTLHPYSPSEEPR